MAIDKIIDRAATISVTSTDVSDDANTSTGALDLPVGTTAQRPGSPTSGNIRFNTDTQTTEIYDGTAWGKVDTLVPTLTSVTGNIVNSTATTLTLAGTNFLSSNLVVGFTPSGGSETTATVTPTSDTAATVAVPAAIYGESASTVIAIKVTNSDNRISGSVNKTVVALPSGGDTISTSGNYRIHTFESDADFVNTVPNLSVEYLIVAGGGGGGGTIDGGGGGGGFRTNVSGATSGRGAAAESAMTLSVATYPVVVGPGGAGHNAYNGSGTVGSNSSFNGITSLGGGHGGGGNGGSGGGAPHGSAGPGTGTSGQGYDGGSGTYTSPNYPGGGGGGAGANGQSVSSGSSIGGAGGAGQTSSITGSAVTYAGGGGAGYYPSAGSASSGGAGGGGQGGTASGAGTDGLGGGGGASGTNGDGGDGIVIVRYDVTAL